MKEKNKRNVLIVTDFYYPHWTGIAKAILNMTKELKDEFNFTILTVRFDKSLAKEEMVEGSKVIRADYLFSLSRAKYSLSIIGKCWELAQKNDTVLINSPNTNILPFAVITKLFGKKLVTFHQGDLTLPGGFKDRIIEKVFDISTWGAFALADGVSTYTKDYAENSRVLRPFMKKFTPLLPPFILPKKESLNKNLMILEAMKKKGYTVLGFAGRFVNEKGFDVLFKAIPKMETNKKYVFAFAGEVKMSYEDTYEKLKSLMEPIQDKVFILGLLNDTELLSFYKMIDIIVMPSRSDCFPLVQAEATIAGAPSICADIPGARMLVKTTGYGVLFAKENDQDLAEKLDEVIEDPNQFKKNHGNVLQMFDINANTRKIADYLK